MLSLNRLGQEIQCTAPTHSVAVLRSRRLGHCDGVTVKPFCRYCMLEDERFNLFLKNQAAMDPESSAARCDNLKSHNSETAMSSDCVGYWQRYYTACVRLHDRYESNRKTSKRTERTNRRGRTDKQKITWRWEKSGKSLNEEKEKEIRQSLDKWEGLSGIAPFYSVPRP